MDWKFTQNAVTGVDASGNALQQKSKANGENYARSRYILSAVGIAAISKNIGLETVRRFKAPCISRPPSTLEKTA